MPWLFWKQKSKRQPILKPFLGDNVEALSPGVSRFHGKRVIAYYRSWLEKYGQQHRLTIDLDRYQVNEERFANWSAFEKAWKREAAFRARYSRAGRFKRLWLDPFGRHQGRYQRYAYYYACHRVRQLKTQSPSSKLQFIIQLHETAEALQRLQPLLIQGRYRVMKKEQTIDQPRLVVDLPTTEDKASIKSYQIAFERALKGVWTRYFDYLLTGALSDPEAFARMRVEINERFEGIHRVWINRKYTPVMTDSNREGTNSDWKGVCRKLGEVYNKQVAPFAGYYSHHGAITALVEVGLEHIVLLQTQRTVRAQLKEAKYQASERTLASTFLTALLRNVSPVRPEVDKLLLTVYQALSRQLVEAYNTSEQAQGRSLMPMPSWLEKLDSQSEQQQQWTTFRYAFECSIRQAKEDFKLELAHPEYSASQRTSNQDFIGNIMQTFKMRCPLPMQLLPISQIYQTYQRWVAELRRHDLGDVKQWYGAICQKFCGSSFLNATACVSAYEKSYRGMTRYAQAYKTKIDQFFIGQSGSHSQQPTTMSSVLHDIHDRICAHYTQVLQSTYKAKLHDFQSGLHQALIIWPSPHHRVSSQNSASFSSVTRRTLTLEEELFERRGRYELDYIEELYFMGLDAALSAIPEQKREDCNSWVEAVLCDPTVQAINTKLEKELRRLRLRYHPDRYPGAEESRGALIAPHYTSMEDCVMKWRQLVNNERPFRLDGYEGNPSKKEGFTPLEEYIWLYQEEQEVFIKHQAEAKRGIELVRGIREDNNNTIASIESRRVMQEETRRMQEETRRMQEETRQKEEHIVELERQLAELERQVALARGQNPSTTEKASTSGFVGTVEVIQPGTSSSSTFFSSLTGIRDEAVRTVSSDSSTSTSPRSAKG